MGISEKIINTIDYIGLWEEIHNQDFNLVNSTKLKLNMIETHLPLTAFCIYMLIITNSCINIIFVVN